MNSIANELIIINADVILITFLSDFLYNPLLSIMSGRGLNHYCSGEIKFKRTQVHVNLNAIGFKNYFKWIEMSKI